MDPASFAARATGGGVGSDTEDDLASNNNASSKREMLKFAIPALGIYLSNPLLSNIDNAFVGRTVGAVGLAALSPATLCIDQALYLFSFLSRAATGLASRAYYSSSSSVDDASEEKARERIKEAASPAFSVSFFFGVIMSIIYASNLAPRMLTLLNVDPLLHTSAISYIRWRGFISWATMAQSVLLSLFIVTKDAITPLKIIASAAILNVIGDALLCAWPLRMGCGGAAAATALATLISSGWMVAGLARRRMMPRLKVPNLKECGELLEFTGPLLAITLTRMAGFMNMQRRVMTFGLESLAGYQLCMNLLVFFILFGEPLSQLAQTKLPSLIDSNKSDEAAAIFKSIMTLSVFAALGVGSVSYLTALLGSGLFTSNVTVQAVAKATAPVLFVAVSQTIVGIAVDGALMASRDFGFMLAIGIASFALQAKVLTYCNSVPAVFATFSLRLATYAFFSVIRILTGYGNLGRVMRGNRGASKPLMAG
jgi:Na+-driven multidrug efflux pump